MLISVLTIAISTVEGARDSVLSAVDDYLKMDDLHSVNFLVISQGEVTESIRRISDRLTIVSTQDLGLSKSRNKAVTMAATKWLWFQDDDIALNIKGVARLLGCLRNRSSDLAFIKVNSLEDVAKPYKNYSFFSRHSYLNAIKLSSIQIVVDVEFVKSHLIRFDPRFGLGSSLPCCEENLFLWQCFSLTNDVQYLDVVACYHTTNFESRQIQLTTNYVAKGAFLRQLPIWVSIALLLRWSVRGDLRISRFNRAKSLLKGYFYYPKKLKYEDLSK